MARKKSSYSQKLVTKFCLIHKIDIPVFEYKFHPERKWRFDIAWPKRKLALEVQGGIWTSGRHVRGGALLKEWEKLNTAATMGWRMLYCQPSDLFKSETIEWIKQSLAFKDSQND